MAKKVQGYVKLQIVAGKANPAPPIGPALGQQGVNIMEFCKQFNAKTQDRISENIILPVVITVYSDRSFTFITKTPPASILLKKAAKLESGSSRPNTQKVAKLSLEKIKEIALTKQPDLTAASLDAAMKTIIGTANSMGIEVVGEGE